MRSPDDKSDERRTRSSAAGGAKVDEKPVKLVRKRLDADELASHLRALAAHATDIEVRVKDVVARSSDPTADSLDEVGRKLATGEIAAVQIRFFEADDWWSDTLLRAKDGFRLVRMREGS